MPPDFIRKLQSRQDSFSPELRAHFNAAGKTWTEVFGEAADEVFMTWNYARYIEEVAAKGKQEYELPMYVNCQLPAPGERAGEYPSGGPHPYYLEVYRVTASTIDFYSPDIYSRISYRTIDTSSARDAVFKAEARLKRTLAMLHAMERPGRSALSTGIESRTSDASGSGPTIKEVYRCWTA